MPLTPINIGRDRVVVEEDRLVVDAAVEMLDWEVRNFRRTLYVFRGQRFLLTGKIPQRGGRVHYILEPQRSDDDEPTVGTIVYDEQYVL